MINMMPEIILETLIKRDNHPHPIMNLIINQIITIMMNKMRQ
jgi:hypothetical protein